MAIAAINPVVPGMMFVAELHGLIPRHALIGYVRRPRHHQYRSQGQSAEERYPQQAEAREEICTAIENLGHVSVTLPWTESPLFLKLSEILPTLLPASVSPGHPATD